MPLPKGGSQLANHLGDNGGVELLFTFELLIIFKFRKKKKKKSLSSSELKLSGGFD